MIRPPTRRVGPPDWAAIPEEWRCDLLTESGEPLKPRPPRMSCFVTDPGSRVRLLSRCFARRRDPAARASDDLRLLLRLSVAALDPPEGESFASAKHSLSSRHRGFSAFEVRRGLFIYSKNKNRGSFRGQITLPIRWHSSVEMAFFRTFFACFNSSRMNR